MATPSADEKRITHAQKQYSFQAVVENSAPENAIELTCDQYMKRLNAFNDKKMPMTLFEVVYGPVIPYYDFDFHYETEAEQVAALNDDLTSSCTSVWEVYRDNARYIVTTACGLDPVAEKWKNSVHIKVRDAGYYIQGSDVPKINHPNNDTKVYQKADMRQLFRSFGATKVGNNRPMKRYESGIHYDALEWLNQSHLALDNETLEDHFITYIGNERLIIPKN